MEKTVMWYRLFLYSVIFIDEETSYDCPRLSRGLYTEFILDVHLLSVCDSNPSERIGPITIGHLLK